MYGDCLVFDQCREFYEAFPSLDLVPTFFSNIGNQMLMRAMIDQIGWQDWSSDQHPFRGSALFGIGEKEYAAPKDLRERVVVK